MTRDEQPMRRPPCPPEKIDWGYTMSRDAEYVRLDERKPAKADRSEFVRGFGVGVMVMSVVGLIVILIL